MPLKLIRRFDEGGNELPPKYIEVSDEQVYFEQLAVESNEAHHLLLQAYKNWDSLNPIQKERVLKALLQFYLVHEAHAFLAP